MKTRLNFSVVCVALLAAAGVIASVFPAAAVQSFAIVTCAATTACTGGTNTSSGPGVQGISLLGKGVVGQAKFNSTSSSNGQSGVLGQDLSTSGSFDTGVSGTSVRGTGVSGKSTSNIGVRAISSSNAAVFGSTTNGGFALEGSAPNTVGVLGTGRTGLEGVDNNAGGDVIFANGTGSNLIRANNSGGLDVFVVGNDGLTQMKSANIGDSGTDTGLLATGRSFAIEAQGTRGGRGLFARSDTGVAVLARSSGDVFLGLGPTNNPVFQVDDAGNVHAHSFIADLAATTRAVNGLKVSTYSSEARSPMIEDFGEATLTAGRAYVRLDPAFVSVIAHGTPYLVFITAQAPVRSPLFVTQKTPLGFNVGEAYPERSAIVFDYRIIAKRYAPQAEASANIPQMLNPTRSVRPLLKHPLSEKLRLRP